MMLYNHLILYHPPLLLLSNFLSIRAFSNKSALCIKWPKYWSFSFSISSSNEYSELISFNLLAIKGTPKSLLQHHSSKASIFQHSAFFLAHLSHLYMTNGKTIALTIQTFAGKLMPLLFNRLSRFVVTFFPNVQLCDPRTVACQAPLSMWFPRQDYWSGLPFPPPGDLPDSGIKPVALAVSPALQADSLLLNHLRGPNRLLKW